VSATPRLLDRWLGQNAAPLVCAFVTAVCVRLTWGVGTPWPVMHDEWAYWMQAGQYAANMWSAPSQGMPEFFEQLYVIVTPVFAAKYWPGHAMMLAPGFAVGAPALMPILLSAIAGGLVFALARRVAGVRVAALTFVLWVSTFGNLRFRASYFSELTTSCLWLGAWYALLRWRETRRWGWMALLAVATGWGAITRPATMLVFAIPVGLVVLADSVRARSWRDLAIGVACGSAVLMVIPYWAQKTTGDWRTPPLAEYTRAYLPFDVPGYYVDMNSPTRALPAEMERVRDFLRQIKVEQVEAPVWRTFAERAGFLLRDAFAGWRIPFVLTFAVGLVVGGRIAWFAFGSALLLVAGYVTQAHTRDWTIYYLEAFPAVAFVAALGVQRLVSEARKRSSEATGRIAPRALNALALVAVVLVTLDTLAARSTLARVSAHTRAFRAGIAALGNAPKIVFVRYAANRNMHLSLVANEGDLAKAKSWIVHDRGAENAKLVAAAPNRVPYLYDEATNSFTRMVP
jgi:hypothetical protein